MAIPRYSGTENFANALMGGGGNESLAYDMKMQRLINQRSSTALMDKRIQEAIIAKTEADQFIGLKDQIQDPRVLALTQSPAGTGANYSAAQTGEEQRMQNELTALILPLMESGVINPDKLNQLIAGGQGKLLSHTNVGTEARSGAAAGADNAMARYRDALTGKAGADTGTANARTDLVNQQIQTEEARGIVQQNTAHRLVTDRDLQEARKKYVESQTKYTDERYRGGPSGATKDGNRAFDNAALSNALLGTVDPDTGMITIPPEFFQWQAEYGQQYPFLLKDDRAAFGAWTNRDQPGFDLGAYANAYRPDVATTDTPQLDPMSAITGVEAPGATEYTQQDIQTLITAAEELKQQYPGQAAQIDANLQALIGKSGNSNGVITE